MNEKKINDWLSDQIVHISKSGAYDAIAPKMAELQAENEKLKTENRVLKIELEAANERIAAYQEYREGVKKIFAPDPNDIKDINI